MLGTAATMMVGAGATLSYAKFNPQFRVTLKKHVAFTDNTIKFIWQEEQTYGEYLKNWFAVEDNKIDINSDSKINSDVNSDVPKNMSD